MFALGTPAWTQCQNTSGLPARVTELATAHIARTRMPEPRAELVVDGLLRGL